MRDKVIWRKGFFLRRLCMMRCRKYIKEAFEKNCIAPLGFNCEGFEKEMQEYLGEGHCLALSLGTAARANTIIWTLMQSWTKQSE